MRRAVSPGRRDRPSPNLQRTCTSGYFALTRVTGSRDPLVSIITPTLNQASFIEATLCSVMGQTYPAVQHIVVDGGSRDGTQEILERYEGRYDLKWSSGPDSGMYDAINRGMALAEGTILAYLNSDDLYLPWTIETVVRRFGQDRDADVVYGDALLLDERTRRARVAFYPPLAPNAMLRGGFLVQPTVFWRREAYDAVSGFDETLQFVGDLDYLIRLARSHRFAKVDEILAVERQHAAAKTSAFLTEVLAEANEVRSKHETDLVSVRSAATVRASAWAWRRWAWLRFLVASRVRHRDAGAWSRFLEAAKPSMSTWRVAIVQVPFIGWRFADGAIAPSPDWLDGLVRARASDA